MILERVECDRHEGILAREDGMECDVNLQLAFLPIEGTLNGQKNAPAAAVPEDGLAVSRDAID